MAVIADSPAGMGRRTLLPNSQFRPSPGSSNVTIWASPRSRSISSRAESNRVSLTSIDHEPSDVRAAGGGSIRSHSRSPRSEEHTSELQSLMRISYAVFCLKKKKRKKMKYNLGCSTRINKYTVSEHKAMVY